MSRTAAGVEKWEVKSRYCVPPGATCGYAIIAQAHSYSYSYSFLINILLSEQQESTRRRH
jgi:hypothetical protein